MTFNCPIRVIILTYAFITLCVPLYSQNTSESLQLNLHEALRLAKENFPLIKQREAELKMAEQQRIAASNNYLPVVGAQAQTYLGTANQVHGISTNYLGIVPGISGGIKDHYNDYQPNWTGLAALSIDWQVFNFGRKKADLRLSDNQIEFSKRNYEQEVFEHQVKVADTYLMLLNAQKYATQQREYVRRTEEIVAATRTQSEVGLKAGIDSSIATAEASKMLLLWMESKVKAQKFSVALAELIGQPEVEIEVDTMLFFTQLPTDFNFQKTDIDNHPRLKTISALQKSADSELTQLKKSYLPSVFLTGNLWGRGSGIPQNPEANGSHQISSSLSGINLKVFNYGIGASLVWQPSRWFIAKPQMQSQTARIEALNQVYKHELNQTYKQLKQTDLQFNLANQAVQQTPLQLHAARSAWAQSKSRYENGLENIIFLTQVIALYNRAETEYLISVNNVWRSLLHKAAAKGDLNVFLDQIPQ